MARKAISMPEIPSLTFGICNRRQQTSGRLEANRVHAPETVGPDSAMTVAILRVACRFGPF